MPDKFIFTKEGIKVYYRIRGKKPPFLVFLHGLGSNLSVWEFMEKKVYQKRASFLSVDLRGHGLSQRVSKKTMLKIFSGDILEILEKENITKAILVGHCFGGMIAQEISLIKPEIVEKIIFICSSYKLPKTAHLAGLFMPLLKLVNLKPRYERNNFIKFKNSYDLDPIRIYSDIYHTGSKNYAYIFESILGWNRSSDLRKVNCPVLIIAGKKDIFFPLRTQKKFANFFPKSRLIIINSNHLVPLNAIKEISRIILDAISTNNFLRPYDI